MFEQVLFGNTKEILVLLGRSGLLKNAYLAGGTGAALQLGHRISNDLDFFTSEKFDCDLFIDALNRLTDFKLDEKKWGTVLGYLGETRFSIFWYRYAVVLPLKAYENIGVMDVREIAAMKLEAIATRGKKRDFVDLYYVIKQGESLDRLIALYEAKYGRNGNKMVHILKSLAYFDDAENDAMPKMLVDIKWKDIKKFFENEVKRKGREIVKEV
jgi:hypothetical protein